jgi:uncharacterized coiled-coil DUF342 family protein
MNLSKEVLEEMGYHADDYKDGIKGAEKAFKEQTKAAADQQKAFNKMQTSYQNILVKIKQCKNEQGEWLDPGAADAAAEEMSKSLGEVFNIKNLTLDKDFIDRN